MTTKKKTPAGALGVAADDAPVSQPELYESYFELHSSLREGYWYAPDENTGDRLAALADACFDILTALNQDNIRDHAEALAALQTKMDMTNERLRAVQKEIDQIIHGVAVAAKIIAGIDKAIGLATKFLA